MKIPGDTKDLIVTNGKSAYAGSIAYTKNIDLSEDGYIKLAAPMCRIMSSEDDGDFGLPLDIFSWRDGDFKVITDDGMFNFALASLSFTEDDSNSVGVTPTDKSRVVQWVGGNWFLGADDVYDYTGATGNTVYASRINNQLGYIEVFVSRNTLVGESSDNILKQYDSSFADTPSDLVLPENFVITGSAFSNLMMGIATRQGKNRGKAFFFTWDGSTAEADNGYPVDDPYILDIAAYDSSWVLFTSKGELLYFNGGGFEQLGTLPTFDRDIQLLSLGPQNSVSFGKIIDADGKRVYVNCGSLPEIAANLKPYLPLFSGGAYCYDPKNGFYHLHAPSYSEYAEEQGTASGDVITFAFSHYLETGDEVWLRSDDQGLTGGRIYYVIKKTATTIQLADSYQHALNGTALDITDGTINLFFVKRKDYGVEALRLQDMGLIKNERAFEGFYDSGALSFFLGAALHPNNVTSDRVNVLCAKVPMMSNRGFVVYGRFQTDALEDMWKGVAVKYAKLKPGSSIIVKAKTVDQDPVIVGDETLFDSGAYSGESVTWDSNGDYFETTSDLSEVRADDEVHIFCGAGAGQAAHIKQIEQSGSVWQVTLYEKIRGTAAGLKSCVSIERYQKLGVITSDDDRGVKELKLLGKPSESMEVKLELRGVGVKVKEVIPLNQNYQFGG